MLFTTGSFAYDHFQFYDINANLFFTLGAKKRKVYQNGIFIHFSSCLAAADWTAYP